MKSVIVTGATSMIGIALIEQCLKNDVEVYAVVRPNTDREQRLPVSERLHKLEYELDGLRDIEKLDIHCDTFYHLAWAYTGKETRNNPHLQEQNIKYTLEAVSLANALGCEKFIGAGSQAEYGSKDMIISTNTCVSPETSYGISKYAASLLAKILCEQSNINFAWARIFSVYGLYDNQGTMIKYAIEELKAGRKPHFSDSTQPWDYLYSEDAGRALYLLGKFQDAVGVFNIANGNSRPLREYIEIIRDIINPNVELGFGDIVMKEKPLGIQADISSLTESTGFVPEMEFHEGIKNILQQMN